MAEASKTLYAFEGPRGERVRLTLFARGGIEFRYDHAPDRTGVETETTLWVPAEAMERHLKDLQTRPAEEGNA